MGEGEGGRILGCLISRGSEASGARVLHGSAFKTKM